MTTKHETVLQALHGVLDAALTAAVTLEEERPASVPAGGLADVSGTDPQELDRRLGNGSGGVIEWQRDCLLVLIAEGSGRRAAIEAMLSDAGAAIEADRTLGGAVDWTEIGPPETAPETALVGTATARDVTVTFSLFYETGANPLEAYP